jgi:protein-arginine kinase activator protein McsA
MGRMSDKIRTVVCQYCRTEQETLVFRREGLGLCYVCRECGQRNSLQDDRQQDGGETHRGRTPKDPPPD